MVVTSANGDEGLLSGRHMTSQGHKLTGSISWLLTIFFQENTHKISPEHCRQNVLTHCPLVVVDTKKYLKFNFV